ncbi:MAG: 4Fe-4S binding protein [Oscillospiraceae bacterium]|jgi:Na+-translocating ferredoxin:NAD+ oxidoreductase RNF subunit RnfB|nr:4Fe-4S binding protein [Oscillospiraceae bacterium]
MNHSVTLIRDKCKGCTTCIKHCPTEAIRVRRGKAIIVAERCIDCGQCIRVCPHHAKRAVCDGLDRLSEFDYTVALPAPSLYGQFHNLDDVNIVLAALLDIGFDAVFEVARAAEIISDMTRQEMGTPGALPRPVISSACPASVRLICQRFPGLMANVLPFMAPVELASVLARREAMNKTGLSPERIGVFFLTPCPAKATAVRNPIGLAAPVIDGAIALSELYLHLLPVMKKRPDLPDLATAGLMGLGWAVSGGESAALLGESYLAVDGIENVIQVLEDIEDGKLPEVEFLELSACTQGCVGGCLTVENPFAAKARMKRLMKFLPVSRNKVGPGDKPLASWGAFLSHTPVFRLDADMQAALEKQARIEALAAQLPGLDCSSCGAPSCRSLAEDVVLGFASEEDCIFRMRERVMYLSGDGDAEQFLPPPFRRDPGAGDN